VLRLHSTFDDTAYRTTPTARYLFIFILGTEFVLTFAVSVVYILYLEDTVDGDDADETVSNIGKAGLTLFLILFFVGSAMAVAFFVNNLSELAESRSISLRNLAVAEDDVALDKSQQKLSDLAARYLLLFGFATTSTILCFALTFVEYNVFATFFVIDHCINLICLYLQFAFAQKEYNALCGCLDRKCREMMTKRTRRSIHQRMAAKSLSRPPTLSRPPDAKEQAEQQPEQQPTGKEIEAEMERQCTP